MLGSKALLIPGIVLLVVGFGLQAGATGAVRAIKMSLSLRVEPGAARAAPTRPSSPSGPADESPGPADESPGPADESPGPTSPPAR
jgi:hypothetical protein